LHIDAALRVQEALQTVGILSGGAHVFEVCAW
jgi:hypothetical protein